VVVGRQRATSYRVIELYVLSVMSLISRVLPYSKPHNDGIKKGLLINKIKNGGGMTHV
jgi:hypothetical protein